MKRSLVLGLLAASVLASAQTVQTARTYKVGDVDAYHMTMKMQGMMAMTIGMDTGQRVLAVYDNGDADVESTVSNMTMDMMGQKRKLPDPPATKTRVTKYGAPAEGTEAANAPAKRGAIGADFAKYLRRLPRGEMKVGQTIDIDEADPGNAKMRIKGHTTLESVTGGIAKYATVLDVSMEGSAKPMHVDFVSMVEAATAKPQHIEGKVTNLEGAGGMPKGMPVTSMTIVMDRKA